MTQSISQDLAASLQGGPVRQIAESLGIDPGQAASAVSVALPLLLSAVGRNASQPQGAQALHGALQEHAGTDIGGVLGAVLGGAMGGASGSGNDTLGRMLGHIFGNRQPQASSGLGQATGLGSQQAQMLLRILAPIVLAYLANHVFGQRAGGGAPVARAPGVGAATPQAISDVLGREAQQISRQHSGSGVLGDVLGRVFDRDGDGHLGLGDLLEGGGTPGRPRGV